jgi:hypothetical protein
MVRILLLQKYARAVPILDYPDNRLLHPASNDSKRLSARNRQLVLHAQVGPACVSLDVLAGANRCQLHLGPATIT